MQPTHPPWPIEQEEPEERGSSRGRHRGERVKAVREDRSLPTRLWTAPMRELFRSVWSNEGVALDVSGSDERVVPISLVK